MPLDFSSGGTPMPLDFSSGGTPVQTGVLDFSAQGTLVGGKPKRTPQQVMQKVAAAQASRDVVNPPETQGLIGKIAASPITGGIVNVASLRPLMTGIGHVASFIGNTIANDLNFTGEQQPKPFVIDTVNETISQEPGVQQPFGAGRPMVQVPLADPQARMGIRDVSALPQVLGQLVERLSTPENVATLPLAAGKSVGGQVAATLFAPQMISSGVESGMQALDSQLDPRAREEAAWNATINLLLGGKIGKGLLDARPWTPEVLPPLQRPVAPVGRQLPAPPEPFIDAEVVVPPRLPAPGERPTMPTGSPLDRPAGAARFGVDPTGKAVDISQLSPKEQIELYRGPKEFVPREQYVRPSQGPVPIVGEQKMMPNPLPNVDQPLVPFQNETRPLKREFVPSKLPVEPSGGKVSFRAPAQAQGIPSARQSALPQAKMPKREVVFQNETAPLPSTLPPENPAYRAPKAAPTLEEYQRQQRRANVEQGLTMEQPPMEPLPLEVGQYPEPMQSGRALSKLQRERLKLAIDQGKPVEVIQNILRVGQEKNPPQAPPAKPTVAKLSTSGNKNPLGDPMGSTYYATPEDWSAWQKVQEDFKDLLSKGAEFDGPEMMKVRQENENIKNRYGGMPPVKPKSGGIGGGIKGAVDKNKEAGSVENPFARIVDKLKNKEKEKRGDTFALSGPRIALDPKESGFKDVTKKVDAQQLWNRVKNKLTPAERDIYEKNGVDKKIVEMGKVSPEEAAQMLQDNGVEVQTHSYGMEGKVSEAKKEYDTLSHSFYDNLTQVKKKEIDDIWYRAYQAQDDIGAFMRELSEKGFTKEEQVNAKRYFELGVQLRRDGGAGVEGPRATYAYDTVSAFSTKEPMPEWTTTKSGKNVQRVDVVIPEQGNKRWKELDEKVGNKTATSAEREEWYKRETGHIKDELWTPDNLHENLPNTLGWAMIQYKTGPKGEKIAVIAEAQSEWAKGKRLYDQWVKTGGKEGEKAYRGYDYTQANHPLLRDYNRLILKAAIDQARKEGATHIVVSDAESAMMTEEHDVQAVAERDIRARSSQVEANEQNKQRAKEVLRSRNWSSTDERWYLEQIVQGNEENLQQVPWQVAQYLRDDGINVQMASGSIHDNPSVSQEPGMRLNYDEKYWTLADEKGNLVKDAGIYKTAEEAARNAKAGQVPKEKTGALNGIMQELTGQKGERVSLGEHKNAFEESSQGRGQQTNEQAYRDYEQGRITLAEYDARVSNRKQARSNLIFRNPDGTPKTDISGTMYKIPQTDKKFSLFEKDRPESVAGRLYMNPIGPVVKQTAKDVGTVVKKGKEVATDFIRAYAEPLQEQIGRIGGPVSKKVSEEAGQIISRGKELYGELTPIIDPAKKQVGKMMRGGTTWMRGRNEVTSYASFNNFFGVNEGVVQTPLNAKRGMRLAADANLAIGKMAERANPGFKASGKLQRIPTTVGYDFIVNGGEGRNRWIEGVAKLNNKPITEVKNFFNKMKETLGDPSSDAASLDRINQDFTRKFPRTITHIKTATGWHEVVVSDPFNYLEQAAQRTAHSVAFREVYPLIEHNGQWVQSGKLQATRKAIMKELDKGSDIVKFDNLVKALQGHPLDTFKGGATTAIGAVSGVIGSPLKALMLSVNAPVNIGEVLSGGPSIFMGYTTMGKAVAKMLTDNTFYDQLELTGARNKAMYNMALDPSSPLRSVAREVATGVRVLTGQQFLNEIQEATAAASAKVYSDAIKGGQMSKYSLNRAKALFRAMGFNEGQASKMVKGDVELLKQFENRAAAWLTTGNQSTAEMSRLGASRLFNATFWFHKYPQMTLNQFRSVGGNLIDDIKSYGKSPSKANWSPLYHNSVLMGRILGGRAFQGAITIGILAGVSGGIYGIYQTIREALEEPIKFIGDSMVSGFNGPLSVLQRLNQNVKGGESFTKELVKLSAPASINQDLIDMGMGVGRYAGMSKMESISTFLESKTPISRTIRMGLAVSGLAEKDLELEVAMKAFYKWRKEQPGFVPMGQMGGTDEQVEIRSGMQKVKKAIESGEDWVAELKKVKDTKGAGASLRAGTMLQLNGKPLDAEQMKSLEKRLGANGLEKIKLRDAMVREVGRELNEKTESGEKQAPEEIKKPTGKWAVDYETDSVRSQRVMGKLDSKVQEFLKQNGVEDVGYTPSLKRGPKRQQLTVEQAKVLEDELVVQLDKMVGILAKNKNLESQTPKLRQILISNMLEGARKIAMAKSLGKIPQDPEQLGK